jgi:hypothetical protein
LTVVYVTVVSIATEYGENQRFRAMIDPILLATFGAFLVTAGMSAYRAARARNPQPQTEISADPALAEP